MEFLKVFLAISAILFHFALAKGSIDAAKKQNAPALSPLVFLLAEFFLLLVTYVGYAIVKVMLS